MITAALLLLPIYGTIYIQGDLPPSPEPEVQCAVIAVACEPPKAVRLASNYDRG